MAISAAIWSYTPTVANDPYIHATDHSWTSTTNYAVPMYISLINGSGFINRVIEHAIQEVYWQKDSETTLRFDVYFIESEPFLTQLPGYADQPTEFGQHQEMVGDTLSTFAVSSLVVPDTKDVDISYEGKASGSIQYSLFIFSAYCWVEKDPAQIAASWIVFHTPSNLDITDFIDKASFQSASAYYDSNPCKLTVIREEGLTILEQLKKLMGNTTDMLSIRPAASGGDVAISFLVRGDLEDRTVLIDLESSSVRQYIIRPGADLTLDEMRVTYGAITSGTGFSRTTKNSPPLDLPGSAIVDVYQKVRDEAYRRSAEYEALYHVSRSQVLNHNDLAHFTGDQEEVEISFGDLSHLNFEAGDMVHISGRGYDGTEYFLVTEKVLDLDTMLATARLLRIRVMSGKTPVYADAANLLLSLTPNSLGHFFDGSDSIPKDFLVEGAPPNLDRWWDESGGNYAVGEHYFPQLHDRGNIGTSSGPPDSPLINHDMANGWPGLVFSYNAPRTGLMIDRDTSSPVNDAWIGLGNSTTASTAQNYTFYCVILTEVTSSFEMDLLDTSGTDDLTFAFCGGGSAGKMQYYDGSWHGSVTATTGLQILTFVLDDSGASIRRNGSVVESGLSYTKRRITNTNDCSIGCNSSGTGGAFDGGMFEMHLFTGAHSTATIEDIEARLADKYGITI